MKRLRATQAKSRMRIALREHVQQLQLLQAVISIAVTALREVASRKAVWLADALAQQESFHAAS